MNARQIALASMLVFALASTGTFAEEGRPRWSVEQAQAWQANTPWLVGSNFAPAYAINQLEMWQSDTFDLAAIDRELTWAEGLGFNSMRVFLHHLLWEQDPEGFLERMDQFLATAEKHHIGVMFVLFDSVWDPHPQLGKQRQPQPGLHNSGWVQSPGARRLAGPKPPCVVGSLCEGRGGPLQGRHPRAGVGHLERAGQQPFDQFILAQRLKLIA
jgi:hypothetical protein